MMVRVNGREIEWREGMTVADLLNEMGDSWLCPVVRVGGKIVTRPNFHKAHVPDNTDVHLLHLIAGG
jgi:thiamine biosynthesis protein ThiS